MTDDDQVRRLLEASRAEQQVPAHVSARLDDVLAGLVAERAEADVVPLRRRRRRAASLVLAAAAVVVAGVAVSQFQPVTSGDDAGQSAESSDGGGEDRVFGQQDDDAESTSPEEDMSALTAPSGSTSSRDDVSALGSATLRADVLALRSAPAGPAARKGCPAPGPGEVRQVTYDGVAAALVLRPVEGDTQRAEVFPCGADEAVASVLLPAP